MSKLSKSYKDEQCPDCSEGIPEDAVDGDTCKNCGHVFWSRTEKPQDMTKEG